jgi:glycosyltransferase involved in cell wall biosynthesis
MRLSPLAGFSRAPRILAEDVFGSTYHPGRMRAKRDHDGRIGVLTLGLYVGTWYGGAERVAYEFAKRLDPERFRSYLCVVHAPPPDRRDVHEADMHELERLGVHVLRLECDSFLSNIAWARLYKLLRRESIGVLHAHMPRASVPGTILARLARTPVVVSHEHTWSFQGMPVRRFLDRNVVARGSDVMLAVSERDRQQMIAVERIPAAIIRVLPNGIPTPAESGVSVRDDLGVAPDVGLIGSVGRLYPQKGYDDLIRAAALLKQNYAQPFRCLILGHGPEEPRLRALIDELGVAAEVQLIGRREDIADVVRAFDVAVLSSKYEGMPLAIIEYMAGGAPIVSTAVGGVPELIEDGVHGLLVRPEDPAELAAAMQRLLEDRDLAGRLGQAAQRRQRANYDLDVVVRRLEDLYLELYTARRGTPVRTRATADSPSNG